MSPSRITRPCYYLRQTRRGGKTLVKYFIKLSKVVLNSRGIIFKNGAHVWYRHEIQNVVLPNALFTLILNNGLQHYACF